jgi:hypothetical protein
MLAWCPKKRRSFFVSKQEIDTLSKAGRYWIEGFLHGSEPEPPLDEDKQPDFESKAYTSWLRGIEQFRNSGIWSPKRRK